MKGRPYNKVTARSSTGVLGVGFSRVLKDGKLVNFFTANLGNRGSRRFNIDRMGRAEAFREALRVRAEYEKGVSA